MASLLGVQVPLFYHSEGKGASRQIRSTVNQHLLTKMGLYRCGSLSVS